MVNEIHRNLTEKGPIVTTNSGVSKNGTQWIKFNNGNVELIFSDGSKTTINPDLLGMSLENAIKTFENQLQTINAILQLSDEEYKELIEDFLGENPSLGINSVFDDANFNRLLEPSNGVSNGIALLPIFLTLSIRGLQNLMSVLGFFPMPVLNSLNQWVIGFQHIINSNELDFFNIVPITLQSAVNLLLNDIATVHMPLIQNLIRVPLTQQQFDSLLGSSVTMGPTRFSQSGIPNQVNSGDFSGAGEIRECYNGTNGEYDPAKGYAANTQSLGIQNSTNVDGQTAIVEPSIVNLVQGIPKDPDTNLFVPIEGLVSAINNAARTSTLLDPEFAAATLYGIAHHESRMGNSNTPDEGGSSASGPYHILNGTWLGYVRDYGKSIPALAPYAEQLKNYADLANIPVALRQQILPFKEDILLSTQIMVKAIDNYYIPLLKRNNLPINVGSIWNAHFLPKNIKQNVTQKLNWDNVQNGYKYLARYFQ